MQKDMTAAMGSAATPMLSMALADDRQDPWQRQQDAP
jgi:hypothetical protein